jgi:hypothetical protein
MAETPVSRSGEARSSVCPNCGYSLEPAWDFCPQCGQENRDYAVSFGTLFRDFLGDIFTFDSRFFRTLGPFLIHPGYLTRDYLDGRRVRYAGPVRMLIFSSIILFALLGRRIQNIQWEGGPNGQSILEINWGDEETQASAPTDSLTMDTLAERPLRVVLGSDSLMTPEERKLHNAGDVFKQIPVLSDSLSPEQVADELVPGSNFWRRKVVIQSAKVYQSKGEGLVSFMVSNGVIAVFLGVFLQALFMRLLYLRRSFHLVEHFVFSAHSHVAVLFIATVIVLLSEFGYTKKYWLLYLLLVPYFYFAMKRVYGQSAGKTLVKFLINGFTYTVIFMPALFVLALLLSFAFF